MCSICCHMAQSLNRCINAFMHSIFNLRLFLSIFFHKFLIWYWNARLKRPMVSAFPNFIFNFYESNIEGTNFRITFICNMWVVVAKVKRCLADNCIQHRYTVVDNEVSFATTTAAVAAAALTLTIQYNTIPDLPHWLWKCLWGLSNLFVFCFVVARCLCTRKREQCFDFVPATCGECQFHSLSFFPPVCRPKGIHRIYIPLGNMITFNNLLWPWGTMYVVLTVSKEAIVFNVTNV